MVVSYLQVLTYLVRVIHCGIFNLHLKLSALLTVRIRRRTFKHVFAEILNLKNMCMSAGLYAQPSKKAFPYILNERFVSAHNTGISLPISNSSGCCSFGSTWTNGAPGKGIQRNLLGSWSLDGHTLNTFLLGT